MPIAKRPNNIVPIPLFNLGVIMVGIKFPKLRIVTFHKSPLCHGERPRGWWFMHWPDITIEDPNKGGQ